MNLGTLHLDPTLILTTRRVTRAEKPEMLKPISVGKALPRAKHFVIHIRRNVANPAEAQS
jgi:hypothetical protein